MANPTEKFLARVWASPQEGASFRSCLVALGKEAKIQGVNFNRKHAETWLNQQNSYISHRQIVKRFPRRKVYARGIASILAIDLLDMVNLTKSNRGIRYILTGVCCFSRRGFTRKLKNKNAETVATALETILQEFPVSKIWCDSGSEFVNKTVTLLLKKYKVILYHTKNEGKSCMVEIFNRTLRRRIAKYLTHNNTKNFVDALDDITRGYNNSYHRSINRSPASVTKTNEAEVWDYLYNRKLVSYPRGKYRLGQYVRISILKNKFEKSTATLSYTDEVFKVTGVHNRPYEPVTYSIEDLLKEPILGEFYSREIAPASFSEQDLKLGKIFKSKKVGRSKQFYVSIRGFPSDYRKWITTTELKALKNV